MALTSSSTANAAAATAIAVPHLPPPFLINRTLVRSRISSSSFNFSLVKSSPSLTNAIHHKRRPRFISCDVALKPNSTSSVGDDLSSLSSSGEVSGTTDEDEELKRKAAKVGARVRVKVPLKVYHVPRLPEVDVTGLEGELKQFVGLWKGKRISANLPYKAEFQINVEGRGPVKFFAHLKEDEFDFI